MSEDETPKNCPCMQNTQDMVRAANQKNNLLKEVTCQGCGKIFWTNLIKEYCFDCQAKKGT